MSLGHSYFIPNTSGYFSIRSGYRIIENYIHVLSVNNNPCKHINSESTGGIDNHILSYLKGIDV